MLKIYITLAVILLLAFVVRFYDISGVPAGFFADEASIGYDAYSLLHTGRDDHGVTFPAFFESLGDFRHPLAVYSAIPFVLFGLNETTTRLPSVIFGLILIVVLYFLGRQIRSPSFGLLIGFIAATMPWLIHYNRTGFEFSTYATLFTATVLFFIAAAKNRLFIIPAFCIAALSIYTYQPAKLLVPVLVVGLLIIYRKKFFEWRRETLIGVTVLFYLSIPLVLSFLDGHGFARFNEVSVFNRGLPPQEIIKSVVSAYLYQLSLPSFVQGEPTFITRHFVGGLPPLIAITVPFIFLGFLHVLMTIKEKTSQVVLYWMMIYPIAGAISGEAPYTSRGIIGAPLIAILIAFGIFFTLRFTKTMLIKRLVLGSIVVAILINVVLFMQFYLLQYPRYSSDYWGWQYGAREIISYFVTQKKVYDNLIMESAFNSPEIFFKFYAPQNCVKCKIGSPDTDYNPKKRQLFAITPTYRKEHKQFTYKIKKTIYYPNGDTTFFITEISKIMNYSPVE